MNLIPGLESIYRWQGKVETAAEVLAVFKTTAMVFPAFEQALAGLHPYEVPEIVALEPAAVADSYLSWVLGNVSPMGEHSGFLQSEPDSQSNG